MTTEPNTEEGWAKRIEAASRDWRAARRELEAAYEGRRAWREQPEQIFTAWAPWCARLSGELGTDFTVLPNGGGTLAINAEYGPVRVMITDYGDGDLSHPEAGKGWWVGFSLPDAPWSGRTESIVGDPDARSCGDLVKLVAFAVAGYFRGERHMIAERPSDYDDGIPRIDYGDE